MVDFDTNRFLAKSSGLLELISEELRSDVGARRSGVETPHLEVAAHHIREMKRNVENDTLPSRQSRFAVLARFIVDEWPLGSELGTEIIEFEKLYQRL